MFKFPHPLNRRLIWSWAGSWISMIFKKIYSRRLRTITPQVLTARDIHPWRVLRNVKIWPRLSNFSVFWAQSRLWQFLMVLAAPGWCQTSQTQHFQNWEPANLKIWKSQNLEKTRAEKWSRSVWSKVLQLPWRFWNWSLRLSEEIEKSCSFRLSVSYDRVSSQLRGV